MALAAIQGLNQKLEEQLQAKEAQIEDLQMRMERLETCSTVSAHTLKAGVDTAFPGQTQKSFAR